MRAGAIVGVALGLVFTGCRSGEGSPIYDLARSAAVAEVGHDQRILDLGTPEVRPSLLSGWSWNERSGEDVTFVWSDGRESVLEVEVYRLPLEELELTGTPWQPEAGSVQEVAVRWNDVALGTVEMTASSGFASYRVPVPPTLVGPGPHRIVLEYAWTMSDRRPGEVSPGRDLGVAWDSIALLPTGPSGAFRPAPAEVEGSGNDIVLPVGVRLGWVLDLPELSTLVIDRVAGEPESETELSVHLGTPDGAMAEIERVAVGSGARLPLEAGPGGWSELWLAGVGDRAQAPASLRLVRPRVVAGPAS